jgi:hypothetical protein
METFILGKLRQIAGENRMCCKSSSVKCFQVTGEQQLKIGNIPECNLRPYDNLYDKRKFLNINWDNYMAFYNNDFSDRVYDKQITMPEIKGGIAKKCSESNMLIEAINAINAINAIEEIEKQN